MVVLLLGTLYAVWLAAGFVDYLCHRRTDIAGTSGATESWLHVAQFVTLGVALLLATLLAITPVVLALIVAAVATHSVLAYRDVAYTQGRRHISPLEQHVHGYLEVVPLVAVGLVAVLSWDGLTTASANVAWRDPRLDPSRLAWVLGSFFALAGTPILEELVRTSRRKSTGSALPGASRPPEKG